MPKVTQPIERQAIEHLLSGVYWKLPEGDRHQFSVIQPGSPMWQIEGYITLYHNPSELVRTSLFVRRHGHFYLRSMSVTEIRSLLLKFFESAFWYIRDIAFSHFEGSFAEHASDKLKDKLAEALANSEIFKPSIYTTVYPLVTVIVQADFDSEPFFLVKPNALTSSRIMATIPDGELISEHFPPTEWNGAKEMPASWIGVRSPIITSSDKMKRAILGAVALTPGYRRRYSFSGRHMFGGGCTFRSDAVETFLHGLHTPPLYENIVLTRDDHCWLGILAAKINASDKVSCRQIHALEYFYRAWPLEPPDRFTWLNMCIDALFGSEDKATESVVNGTGAQLPPEYTAERLKLLMGKLRGEVIHGRAPDVYDAREYAKYYETYMEDPISDLGLIAARSLQHVVFEGALPERPDPYARPANPTR